MENRFLTTRAVIVYAAIALIGTGIYEKSDARIMMGIGLLTPTSLPVVDQKLKHWNEKSRDEPSIENPEN